MRKLTKDGRFQIDIWGELHDFGPPRKKTHAVSAEVRAEECTHDHAPYNGTVPCTGPHVCSMCGAQAMGTGSFVGDQP